MGKTTISWTDETLNVVTGCSHVSEGCRNCYAESLSHKWGWTTKPWTAINAAENVTLHPDRLAEPRKRRKPTSFFICSMGDIFHPAVPDSFLAQLFTVMNEVQRHTYKLLTKRPERMAEWPGPWPAHVWAGTSVEDVSTIHRIDTLRRCRAQVRFVSAEPLLDDLGILNLDGIHQVIVGGESGPGYRPMEQSWARRIRDQCAAQGVAYFYKQDAAFRSGTRPWLVESDGTSTRWHQQAHDLIPPEAIAPADPPTGIEETRE